MAETANKLKKLRGRSLDELRVRGAQALSAFAERRGLSAQARVPGDAAMFRLLEGVSRDAGLRLNAEGLLEHFRARRSPAFFAGFADRAETAALLKERFGREAEEEVLRRADGIVAGRFDLLGLRGLDFGSPPDWHLEPLSGKRAPLRHWSRINYLDARVAGDKKVTWELNRQQHLMTLGRAYWLTGDERYAEAFAAHLSSWMDANPPKLGINWASSLEVAFRSISWLWALYFFRDSPRLTAPLFLRALKFLYLHGRHLETYLSTYFSPNTHLTGEALGLFYLGTLLAEMKCARRWRETGRRVLVRELERHVRADGVYFEQASYYQRYTTDFYTHFLLLSRANGERVEAVVEEKLTRLLDHLMFVTRPDGTTPLYGDDDGGRLVMLDERAADDFRAALSTGAVVFGRGDYRHVAGEAAEETLWLTGGEGLRAFDSLRAEPPSQTSRAFTDGGFYVMRDGWGRDSNFMLLDCGPHGALGGGHAHADALSFDLAARGRTLLVDPGTFTYTGASAERDLFRSSAAHNTLTVDGEPSSVPGKTFRWRHAARCETRAWLSRDRFDYFEGTHDGYARLPSPVSHARAVLFLKGKYWVVRDRVEAEGSHRYDAHFHFAAGSGPSVEETEETFAVREASGGAAGLEILSAAGDGVWQEGEGWVSRCYASRERAPVFTRTAETSGARDFFTFLVPRGAAEAGGRAQLSEVEAVGGRAFELLDGAARDLLLVGGGRGRVETAGAASDFAWAWVRFDGSTGEVEEIVLLEGTHLLLNGESAVLAARGRVGYFSARRAGGELFVETDARAEDLSIGAAGAGRVFVNGQVFAAGGERQFALR